jgi:hypothetical protein
MLTESMLNEPQPSKAMTKTCSAFLSGSLQQDAATTSAKAKKNNFFMDYFSLIST